MIVRCINSDYIIIFLLIVIAVLLVKRRYSKFEHMSNVDVEALRNLSSMYNKGKLKVTELEVTGNIKGKKLEITDNIKGKKLEITGNAEIGPAYIGRYNKSDPDYAQFSHKKKTGKNEYALMQQYTGITILNSTAKKAQVRFNDSYNGDIVGFHSH